MGFVYKPTTIRLCNQEFKGTNELVNIFSNDLRLILEELIQKLNCNIHGVDLVDLVRLV